MTPQSKLTTKPETPRIICKEEPKSKRREKK